MSLKSMLLKIARKVVESVLERITQQLNVIDDQIYRFVDQAIQTIVSGAWQGDDADRFVDEMRSLSIPKIHELRDTIQQTGQSLSSALDVIDQADEQARTLVDNLADTFRAVY